MIVKGVKRTTENVELEISADEVNRIIESQDADTLSKFLQKRLMKDFIGKLKPAYSGERIIRKSFFSSLSDKFMLVNVDEDFDYHNNVGVDNEVRPLTDQELEQFFCITGLPEAIKETLE